MGNRFKNMPEYHQKVVAHGVIAAITFLFMIPAAIFIARFYHQNGRRALRLHIWIQVLVVFLATVVLVLGWFAVGPSRSLTNPHHGIGVALYVLIIFQFLFGSLVHHIEKGKTRYKIPLKLLVRFGQ
jgi:Na+/proline symporter